MRQQILDALYDEVVSSIFSGNLAKWRKTRGMSQRGLAEKSGISSRMIAHYEKEARGIPFDKIEVLCEALGITPSDLFGSKPSKGGNLSEWDLRLLKQLNLLKKLPEQDRRSVTKSISAMLEKHGLQEPHWRSKTEASA